MKCTLCGSAAIAEFLDLGKQPLANKYPASPAEFEREDFFPLTVLCCPDCKNVQLGTMISRQRMFEDYYYLASVNRGLVRHFEAFAKKLAGSRFVVDVGSNDGILLKPLKELGVKALGVDPSLNVSKMANAAGLETMCSYFDIAAATKIREERGTSDAIIASSVFTHLENPHDFIEATKALLAKDGRFIIEVEYVGNIFKNTQFERFYLDRIFYFSLTSLRALFESHKMKITDVELIEPHGGSLRVTAQRHGEGSEPAGRVVELIGEEKLWLTPERLRKFASDVTTETKALRAALEGYKKSGLTVAGYGAPARVSTICNFGGIGPELVQFTVDDSPLKEGRFTPGTHIPIVKASHLAANRPDVLIVFAYEYMDDIRAKTGGSYKYFVPIPFRETK